MWERVAWHVAALAGELDVALDADAMALCDVRDLLALRACLRHHLRQGARRRLWLGRRHPACARAHTLLCFAHARRPGRDYDHWPADGDARSIHRAD